MYKDKRTFGELILPNKKELTLLTKFNELAYEIEPMGMNPFDARVTNEGTLGSFKNQYVRLYNKRMNANIALQWIIVLSIAFGSGYIVSIAQAIKNVIIVGVILIALCKAFDGL